MKKRFLAGVLAMLTASSVILGGCGKAEDKADSTLAAAAEAGSQETENTGNNTESGAATGDEQEQVTIKFTYWGSGDEKKAIEEAVEKFMETYPNITVDLMHIPNEDFLTKLNAMIAAGEAPDGGKGSEKQLTAGLGTADIKQAAVIYADRKVKIYKIDSPNFIDTYQGRIYTDSMEGCLDAEGNMDIDKIEEFIFVAYQYYMDHAKTMKKLFPEMYKLVKESIE